MSTNIKFELRTEYNNFMNYNSVPHITRYSSGLYTNPITLEHLRASIKSFEEFVEPYLSKEAWEEAIKGYKWRDIFQISSYPTETCNLKFHCEYGQLLGAGYDYVKFYECFKGKQWERTEYTQVFFFLESSQYDIISGKIAKNALLLDYPWLEKYRVDFYSVKDWREGGFNDFYIHYLSNVTEKKNSHPLYVPLELFAKGDIDGILKHNIDYWKKYYNRKESKEFLDKVMSSLESEDCKNLLKKIAENKH